MRKGGVSGLGLRFDNDFLFCICSTCHDCWDPIVHAVFGGSEAGTLIRLK